MKKPPRPKNNFLRDIVETVLLVAIVYTLFNLVATNYLVEGHSMEPSFYDQERIIVSRLAYIAGEPARGDVIVITNDDANYPYLIKRLVGLPGEHIRVADGMVFVNGVALEEPYIKEVPLSGGEWQLGPDEYFVMGDNRNHSRDSRVFGPITSARIVGKTFLIYWPPEDFGIVPGYDYATEGKR